MNALVLGVDTGSSGGMLVGLREWLIVRLGHGDNLVWVALVRHLVPGGFMHLLNRKPTLLLLPRSFDCLTNFWKYEKGATAFSRSTVPTRRG
ncbi:hypothetical protein [Streptomyces pinistramenti]|uniref:hypothetical protein n=1 Tax=Streptomyces pinistramenti TaxID=2884812 RepID=UPI001D08170A|nr:hypothetical protein [Streptomyces pinistramenti]MCB5912351.1 hypothetical protein [Streptomyces pinistramenti]